MGKIKKVYIIFFLLAGLLFIGLFLRLDGRKKDIVMWIGEIPVYRTEFEEAMKEEYANTCGYFSRTYGASIDENFWHMEYDGITPLNYLKEKTGEKLIEEKMIQLVGLELGMEIETGYENRMVNWKGENEARRRAAAANQPVYGPIQLEWRQYKMDVQGDLIQNIKNKLYENKTFSKAELDAYYEAHKESYFKNPGDYKIEYAVMPILWKEEGVKDEKQDKRIRQIMESFARKAEEKSFHKLGEEYEATYKAEGFSYESESITEDLLTRVNMLFPTVLQTLQTMKEGEISGLIEERNAYYIVRCLEKTEETYEAREEVEESIRRLMVEEAYEKILIEKSKSTKVEINQEVYEKLQLNVEV
ncbi:MAG: peptidyl-prolyl cis-trans isomerase [Lachnospiraceae bacterium]|nr:peptidyl-prolyl cis-trans isomerase [Lachnospiraceae bacterium]MDD7026058.1 peptidyl-prolyl cis-trans isomerase [Lachnospiraceae bacterium]MDY5700014.1 peptidyl-prolyl cis-trans isomerase [Lachnospiraceae bacterium]